MAFPFTHINACLHVWWTHSISTFFNESYQCENESKNVFYTVYEFLSF
jgi:hypothetical protein